jgi:hypothetical protein
MITAVMGKRGMGKSYYLKKICHDSIFPVFIIDTMNEYEREALRMFQLDWRGPQFFKTRYVPKDEADFDAALEMVSINRPSTLRVIVDEVDMFSGSHYVSDALINMLKFSRHYNIDFYCSCRNPVELNRRISGLADQLIIFNLTEPRYLQYFELIDKGLAGRIRALEPHQKIIFTF